MAGPFKDKIRDMRRRLHDYMHVDAFYYAMPKGSETPVVREVRVRIHDKFLKVGDLAGTNFHYAEVEENAPRAIFMRSEISPLRNYYLVTDEAFYIIDHSLPPDDISVTAKLSRLTNQNDIEGLIPFDGVKRAYCELTLPAFQ